jgi:1,2-phenylacetyl-CoA epoxidase PaaB subunit
MSYIDEYAAQGAPTKAPTRGKGSKAHKHIQPDTVWLVLARRTYDEPLRQVGTVEADDRELAIVYARSIYDEFAWIEMVIVPRAALVTVIEA